MSATIAGTLEAAARLEPRLRGILAREPYEAKGVLTSELLFLLAAADGLSPARVFESGRARAQSTRLLALALPGARITSVEWKRDTPDAAVAEERLRGLGNVEALFGDARGILPRLVRPGDVVLIDGPKGFRAVRLALSLLARARPALVFVHDVERGQDERRFLEARVPGSFFSDDPAFVAAHRHLDEGCWAAIGQATPAHPDGWSAPHVRDGTHQESYGPTLACLPWRVGVAYGRLAAGAWWASRARRLRRLIGASAPRAPRSAT